MKIVREAKSSGQFSRCSFLTQKRKRCVLANDTIYGLGRRLSSRATKGKCPARAAETARRESPGLNTYHPTFNEAPWGGYKQSGTSAVSSAPTVSDAYMEVKQININTRARAKLGWFRHS